jgi:hypothetical protein
MTDWLIVAYYCLLLEFCCLIVDFCCFFCFLQIVIAQFLELTSKEQEEGWIKFMVFKQNARTSVRFDLNSLKVEETDFDFG